MKNKVNRASLGAKKNLNLFTWLLECSGNAAKIGLIPCQLRQQDGKNTAKTRQKDGKSSIYRRIITLLTLLLTLGVGQTWADNADVADIGGIFSVNGSTEKYKIATKSDYLTCTNCTDWSIKGWTSFSSHDFGNVSSFTLKGVAVSGWTKSSDWFAAKIFYKIYASGASEPNDNTGDFGVGNYGNAGAGNGNIYLCGSCYESDESVKKVIGMDNQNVDLIGDRSPGVYNMKIFTNTQCLWNNNNSSGTYGQKNDYAAVTATFTVMPLVTYDATTNGGSNGGTTTQYVNYNSSTTLTSVATLGLTAPTGYHFDHWSDGVSNFNDGENVTFTTNKTLTAVYAPNVYSITYYDCNTSAFTGAHTSGYPTSHTYGSATALSTATKSGYTFRGWYSSSNCSGVQITSLGATAYTSNITLYAKWEANITLNANGGSANGSATAVYNSNSNLAISAPTHAAGYYILGYYAEPACETLIADADGKLEKSKTGYTDANGKWIATEDKTLYAQWDNHYTVTFDDHEATIHGTTETTATYGEAMPAITIPRKNGYIFGGYYTGTGGSGTKYYNADGSSANNWAIASSTTLHAQWTGIAYHVSFSANGGTGSMSDQDLTYGTSTPLTSNTYTREGYYFLGWNTNADGSGTAYYNGKSVSAMTTVPGETVTLYAQWAKTQTLYFLNMGTSSWNQGGSAGATTRYAYAFITYDGYEMHPLGTWTNNGPQGTAMTAVDAISLPNVSGVTSTWCWSIANVPEGSTIIFSDNNKDHKTGDLSGWTAEKPYYCNGNGTWYALDGTNEITKMTNWSVHIGKGHFGDSWQYFALDKYDDGTYAKIWLNTDQTYQYKYSNWVSGGGESGSPNNDAYIINGGGSVDAYGPWTLNGDKDVLVKTNTHASGQYKFSYEGLSSRSPITKLYVPRGVNLTSTTPTEAKAGESVTVSLTADAWKNLSSGTDMDAPTYYFEFSTDNSNWTTIATVSPTSSTEQATTDYTFVARSGYFRVKLVNDHGLASYSGSTAFTAYTTKSFYVYNPWNNSTDKWEYLELYTWKENGDADTPYNGSLGDCYIACSAVVGTHGTGCLHGNDIEAMGNNWFKITIDERADYFLLAGNKEGGSYTGHKTGDLAVANYIQDAKYMLDNDGGATLKEYEAKGASDFRLKYTDGGTTRYSDIYNTTLDGTSVIASMWMDANSSTASLAIEQGNGEDSWTSVATYSNSTSNGFSGLVDTDHRSHGYVFQMDLNLSTPAVSNVTEYTGPFYVRTDALDGGWNVYEKKDHMMHYSEHSLNGSPAYNYYLCKWINEAGTNVKFTVANDYNKKLVASLGHDDILGGDDEETLPTATNVRFSWNSQTNTLTRAYLSAATDASSRFLVMIETSDTKGKIYKEDGNVPTGVNRISGLNDNELIFNDKGNWVYQLIIMANPGAKAKVTAKYNGEEPEFIPSTTLIGESGDTKYTYRIVYDFKTNELTNAWVADGNKINESIELNTNVMLVRNGQNAATQLTFGEGKRITEAKKLIGVMEFRYNDMVGKMSSWNSTAYQNCMYYFSFPFDVKVSDIFGVGEMGTDWRIQKYNGAKRALIGWFADTDTFWEDVTAGETLNAYEGYSLLLNRINFNNGSSDVWANISSGGSVYLYFPSDKSSIGTIQVNDNMEITVPSHVCEIDREFSQDMSLPKAERRNHKFTDSNWNMLGSALFENKTGSSITPNEVYGETLNYIYEWNSSDNTLAPRATLGTTFSFNAMHAYLVQFAGKVVFSGASITPASVAARHTVEKKNYMIELELSKGESFAGRAYIELRENAVDSFLLNEDMYMLKNSKIADIYTYAGGYDVAANVLTVGNHIVPVGVNVKSAGEYTFSMPSNFSGEVILIDNYNNSRTNLGIEDYAVTLNKGTIDDRFELEININKVPTAIDGVPGGSLKDGKAHKFIENGAMYILQDGKIYDARGNRLQ